MPGPAVNVVLGGCIVSDSDPEWHCQVYCWGMKTTALSGVKHSCQLRLHGFFPAPAQTRGQRGALM